MARLLAAQGSAGLGCRPGVQPWLTSSLVWDPGQVLCWGGQPRAVTDISSPGSAWRRQALLILPMGRSTINSPFRFFPWPPALGQALSCPVLWAPGELGDLLLGAEQDEIDKHRQDLCSVLCACGDGGMARGLPRTQSGSSQKGGCSCPGRGQGRDGALGRGPAGAKTWGFKRTEDSRSW